MELWIPFMLFIVAWQPDQPGRFDLQRQEILFGSIEQCEKAGREMVDRKNAQEGDVAGRQFSFSCVASPHPDEFEKAFRKSTGRGA